MHPVYTPPGFSFIVPASEYLTLAERARYKRKQARTRAILRGGAYTIAGLILAYTIFSALAFIAAHQSVLL